MNSIIDIYNYLISYNNSKINYLFDNSGNIWFKFLTIADILNYKKMLCEILLQKIVKNS